MSISCRSKPLLSTLLVANSCRAVSARSKSGSPKVALLGAVGGIGQPLGLLLKLNPNVAQLALYDIMPTGGVAADLSHIDSPAKISAFTGAEELKKALDGADIVVIPAGVPRKPGACCVLISKSFENCNFLISTWCVVTL